MRKIILTGIILVILGAFLSGLAFDRYVVPPQRVTGGQADNIVKYCTQVYYGNVPSYLRPYLPPGTFQPNGTYRVYVCQV